MAQQSGSQRATVGRVMHEFKHGELRIRGSGPKVKNPKQAVAIALHEAGATHQESPKKNRQTLRHTKAKERQGETAQARREGREAQDRTEQRAAARGGNRRKAEDGGTRTKAELYAEARRRQLPGRSRMSRDELERALKRAR